MSLAPKPPPELEFAGEPGAGEICQQVASFARREAEIIGTRRFFAMVARALARSRGQARRDLDDEAGAALARELARNVREPWARDGIERGLDLFARCVDETGRRCVANLVAEYFAWREPPDRFFHRTGGLITGRSAAELVRVARIVGAYARLPKPGPSELRLLAALPRRSSAPCCESQLFLLGFCGEPPRERLRSPTKIPGLGSDAVVAALASAEFGWLTEPGPNTVPLVGRCMMCFPGDLDGDLRRLHLLFAAAIA